MRVDVKALTGRESEVLDHLAEGRSNKDIAYRLGISARTVQKHLQRIYVKLAVKGRMAAVVSMVRNRA
jgi:DNA-binding NarL/FixJ family response regulator